MAAKKLISTNFKQSVIIKITKQNLKWSPKNLVQTLLLLEKAKFSVQEHESENLVSFNTKSNQGLITRMMVWTF